MDEQTWRDSILNALLDILSDKFAISKAELVKEYKAIAGTANIVMDNWVPLLSRSSLLSSTFMRVCGHGVGE